MTPSPANCRCGAPAPEPETDKGYKATLMECGKCGRVVGGLDKHEAISLWNAAMGLICRIRAAQRMASVVKP